MNKWVSKKPMMTALVMTLSVGLAAGCGTDNNLSAPPENAPPQNTATDVENEQSTAGHEFTKFDLEVEYENRVKYEAEYKAEGNGEAEIEDDINEVSLKGDEAYTELSPRLEQLKFDSNADQQEVMTQVLEVFGLKDDYKEFELEVMFEDGTVKKYEEKK
ncbi:YusW family protein [Sutcliffiella horikoshii]|uniref:YusW family protein n=1 Tax=Sutcliffiella horikoshii TaxID=79883 RepID=UPI00384A79ED